MRFAVIEEASVWNVSFRSAKLDSVAAAEAARFCVAFTALEMSNSSSRAPSPLSPRACRKLMRSQSLVMHYLWHNHAAISQGEKAPPPPSLPDWPFSKLTFSAPEWREWICLVKIYGGALDLFVLFHRALRCKIKWNFFPPRRENGFSYFYHAGEDCKILAWFYKGVVIWKFWTL